MTHILVVDDHAVVRQGVRQILSEQFRDATIGEAASAQEMMEQLRLHNWDVVVLDVGMPGKSGLDALKEVKQASPKLPVPVLSAYPEDQLARRMLKAGAAGYLNKDSAPNELVRALRKSWAAENSSAPQSRNCWRQIWTTISRSRFTSSCPTANTK